MKNLDGEIRSAKEPGFGQKAEKYLRDIEDLFDLNAEKTNRVFFGVVPTKETRKEGNEYVSINGDKYQCGVNPDGEWAIDRSNRLTRYFIDYKDMPEEELTGPQDANADTSGKSGSVPGFVFLKRKELPPDSRNIRDVVSVPGTEKPVSRQDNMLRCGSDYMREIADQFMQSFSLSSFRTRNSDSLRECLYFAYSEKELTELADDIGAEAYLPDTNLLEFMDVLKDSVREKVLKFSLAWGCANALLSPAIMEERMSGINDRQMETFRRALREKDERGYFRVDLFAESDDLASFAEIGYCFGGKDENTFFIPSDLAEAFAAIDTKEFHERRRQKVWLMDCLDIVDYYYGVIPVRKFYTLYKKYGTLSLEEMIESIKSMDEMETDCVIKDDKIIYFSLLKDDDYKKLESIQAGKPYYFPTKAEVEEISWNGYPVSQKEIQELLAFFRENYFYLDEIDTEEFRDACYAAGVDPDSFTQSDLDELQRKLNELT